MSISCDGMCFKSMSFGVSCNNLMRLVSRYNRTVDFFWSNRSTNMTKKSQTQYLL
ncbi:hypothetical protein HanXRQr2_Chr10g0462161 [Helianthus annuus]|uniref:Uncharacterized protein n=1 Tax=Helianthus annuus TaxID=4232 RepID=A0A9K3N659_HELAN|nr:hypothetical protein HanXRQr2_Chr10g0462161 [Helianthus annuus]KAJ0885508.1 hypothetical protein HanPSC8_Chr10g0446011 [Helianthus annuus]